MKPYPVLICGAESRARRLLCLLGILLVTSLGAANGAVFSDESAKTGPPDSNPQVRAALDDFYNLQYDKAVTQFERILKAHPDDPFAVTHLLQAVVFRELYRLNLLDTTLYAHDGFLSGRPVNGDPAVRTQVEQLTAQAVNLCNERLQKDPNNVNALYARGVAHGLRATYMALVDKRYVAALRNALAARRDHERVLQLDRSYVDAKTVVGAHNYVVGSLPVPVKMLAGVAGISGSKKKGLQYLEEAAKAGGESSVDARVALALFLRREARYNDATNVVKTLVAEYPKNYLFGLEDCNLLKDGGKGPAAIACYEKLLDGVKAGEYAGAHVGFASFGLAESLRGQRHYKDALAEYEFTSGLPGGQPSLKQRASLAAGEIYDLLSERPQAVLEYQSVIAQDNSSAQAVLARKLLRQPYRAQ
ncbi:MAG TPA: hypothetical protein VFQ00_00940 [Terriglobales bacterium]|nr:hypothetical protein [Terriglobales bacterium]